ncbi:MAG: hypothetical protein GY771_16790 [bacterium]|nr:hypothetical protein [bacterium]
MKRILLISLTLSVLLGVACKDPVAPVVGNGAGSPRDCIELLVRAINGGNIAGYRTLLAPDYTFYFNDADVGDEVDGYTIPETWDLDEESAAMGNMFDEAYYITCTIPLSDIGDPPDGGDTFTATEIPISLLVMLDADNGLIANKGNIEFAFEKVTEGDGYYWRITGWHDFTFAKKGVESVSLGEMKVIYYVDQTSKEIEPITLGGVKAYFYTE